MWGTGHEKREKKTEKNQKGTVQLNGKRERQNVEVVKCVRQAERVV